MHIDGNSTPISANLKETDSKGKEYEYSLVHMGGLRPFNGVNFENDGIIGYGGEKEPKYYTCTGTPKLAQYLVFEVYQNRVVFHMRNAGTLENYRKEDKLKEYTVYFL